MPRFFLLALIVIVLGAGAYILATDGLPKGESAKPLYEKKENEGGSNENEKSASCLASGIVPVEICPDAAFWHPEQPISSDYEGFYSNQTGAVYFGFITEGLEQTPVFMRKGILGNVGKVADGGAESVRILAEKDVVIAGHDWHYLEYDASLDGTVFRYGNYFSSFEGAGSAQILIFSSDKKFRFYKTYIDALLDTVKITESPSLNETKPSP